MSRIKKQSALFQAGFFLIFATLPSVVHAQVRHTIQSGDTIYSIARQHNLSVHEVLSFNKIGDPTSISVGTNLLIPNGSAPASESHHTVQKGDTYYSIAKQHGLSVTELLRLNNRTVEQVLSIHDVLALSPSALPVVAPTQNSVAATTPVATSGVRATALPVSATATPAARVAETDGNGAWPHGGERKLIGGKFPAVVINASEGDLIRAVQVGRVIHINPNATFGQMVLVQAPSGHIYIYGGNEDTFVEVGERITPGTLIGRVGNKRIGSQGAEVYFSIWHNNLFIDPHNVPRG